MSVQGLQSYFCQYRWQEARLILLNIEQDWWAIRPSWESFCLFKINPFLQFSFESFGILVGIQLNIPPDSLSGEQLQARSLQASRASKLYVPRCCVFTFSFGESQDFVFCDLIHWLFWDGMKIFERSSCVAIICPVPLDVCLEFYDRAAVAWVVPGALPDLVDSRSLSSASRGWFWRVRDSLLGGIISRRAVQCSGLWLWYGVLYERNS